MTYDQEQSNITYQNARLEAFGLPVFYTPWFRHPVGPPRPVSGLLFPRFGHSTNLGDSVTQGFYYWHPQSNSDYTFRTRAMSARGIQLMAERRQQTVHTESDIRTSFINDTRTGKVRSHAAVNAEYVVRPGQRVGINAETASDDSYLLDFFDRNDNYLPATLYAEDAGLTHYAGLSATHYQDLDPTRDPARTAQVLPRLELEKVWDMGEDGQQLIASGDVLGLTRDVGTRYTRTIGDVRYIHPFMLPDGSRVETTANLRADLYNIDGTGTIDGTTGRVLPEVSAMWEKPFISPGGTHKITPIIMAAFSPKGGNPSSIPNEDSVAYELDVSNLFRTSRFAGLDRVETGTRIMYGLDNRWGSPTNTRWRLFVGQSYRQFDDSNLPVSGGTATKQSDWVGYFSGSPADWFTFYSNFRLDNSDLSARRLDAGFTLGNVDAAYLRATTTYQDDGAKELYLEGVYPINETWEVRGRNRRDLADGNRQLLAEAELVYTHDCYELSFIARRQAYVNAQVQPSTDYLININLLTLGRDDAPSTQVLP